MAKIQIKESTIRQAICEELKKSDIASIVKNDKDIEKYIKQLVADVMTNLFQTLWQQKSYVMQSIVK